MIPPDEGQAYLEMRVHLAEAAAAAARYFAMINPEIDLLAMLYRTDLEFQNAVQRAYRALAPKQKPPSRRARGSASRSPRLTKRVQ